MRIVGALILSLAGAITSFLAVLTILDVNPHAILDASRQSRIGAFAEPRLESALIRDLAVIRPIPAAIEPTREVSSRDQARDFTAASGPRGVVGSSVRSMTSEAKGAFVAPIVRRLPSDPDAVAPAPLEPTIEGLLAAAEAPPRAPTASAGAAAEPAPRLAARSGAAFDRHSRSALGGPRPTPPASPAKAAKPAKVPTLPVAATSPALPKRKPAVPRDATAPAAVAAGT